MSWEDDLESLLNDLDVQQEHPQAEQRPPVREEAEIFYMNLSHGHPGVFYRMDPALGAPELRIWVPASGTLLKADVYLVLLAPGSFLSHLFWLYMTFDGGSTAFQEIEGAATFHLFQAMISIMKALFWKGNLATQQFPPEIEVKCLTR